MRRMSAIQLIRRPLNGRSGAQPPMYGRRDDADCVDSAPPREKGGNVRPAADRGAPPFEQVRPELGTVAKAWNSLP
jgi:hypothetical protein